MRVIILWTMLTRYNDGFKWQWMKTSSQCQWQRQWIWKFHPLTILNLFQSLFVFGIRVLSKTTKLKTSPVDQPGSFPVSCFCVCVFSLSKPGFNLVLHNFYNSRPFPVNCFLCVGNQSVGHYQSLDSTSSHLIINCHLHFHQSLSHPA